MAAADQLESVFQLATQANTITLPYFPYMLGDDIGRVMTELSR